MKKNTFKRVLAGSLALLTVAAYVPANVGGLIQTSLVADAAASATTEKVTFNFDVAKDYLTSVDYGGTPWSETTLAAFDGSATMNGNTAVTVNSKIPLTLTSSKDFSSSLATFKLGTTLTVPGEKVDTTAPSTDSKVYLVSENGTISSKTVTNTVYDALSTDEKKNYLDISTSTGTYLYNGVYYTDIGVTAGTPFDTGNPKPVQAIANLYTQVNTDYSLTVTNHTVADGDAITVDTENKTLTFTGASSKEYQVDISGAIPSTSNYIDILTVDTTKYGTFTPADTSTNTSASFSKNYPVSTVMNEVLKANNYETTDTTFTTDSEFVAVGKNAFLLVRFSAKETKNNDGTYKYDFTVPNITGAPITVGTIAQDATVNFYKSEADRNNNTKGTTTEDTTVNAKWKSLTIQVGDVTTNPAPANLAKISGGISSADIAVASSSVETLNLTNTANNELFVGAPVTVTNAEPFALYIDDGSNAQMLTASVTYKDNKFVGTFTMPKYAGSATGGKVTLKFVELTETYTYKTTADKTTLTASGQSVTNTEAASIAVKSYDADSTTGYFIENGDKGVDVGSDSLEYGRDIVIKLTAGDKFISAGNVTITKDSKEVWTNRAAANGVTNIAVSGTALGSKDDGLIKIDNATSGEYKITYKVTTTGTNTSTYTLEKTFTVDAKGAITVDNISLKVSVYKDNTPIRALDDSTSGGVTTVGLKSIIEDSTADNFGVDGTGNDAVAYYKIQCEKGKTAEILLSKAAKEIVEKNGYQFKITPVVTPKNEAPLANTKYTVSGYTTGSKNKDYTVSVTITDPEYGGSASAEPIVIPWKVVDYDSKPDFETSATATVAQEDTNKLGDAIATAIAKNDAAKALTGSDFTFEYVTGASGANRVGDEEDELDSYESGLPTEKGDYTVYVTYKDKVVSTVTVKVTSYKLTLVPDASTLAFTYGKDFTVDSYTLKDANDKVVKDVTISDLGVQFMQPIYKEVNGKKVQTGKYEVYRTHDEGSTSGTYDVPNANNVAYVAEVKSSLGYKTTDSATITLNVPTDTTTTMSNVIPVEELATAFDSDSTSDVTEKLNAGTYYVKFNGTVSNDDYALDTETVYEVTVSRKKLSDSTVTVLIAPAQYAKNTTQSPNASSITALDTDTGFNFTETKTDSSNPPKTITTPLLKLTESFSAVNTGEYDVEVGLTDTQTQNYEGTATAKWHIVNTTSTYTASTFNLQWNTAKTTLFDNGRIHVEITKKDASKLAIGDNTIQQYGVIIEKEGKIPAPATYNNLTSDEKDNAETQLQLNNGFTTGGYTTKDIEVIDEKTGKVIEVRNANSVTYSANIRVVDAETGVWARPYVLLSDGTVAYGEVRYLNIQNEAQEKLNLNMPYKNTSDVVRVSNMTDAQKKEASKYVNAGYDVLLNKYYAYATFTDLSNEGFRDTVLEVADFGVVVDKNGIFKANETDIDKKLRIGKNSKLIVGHYKKGNKNLAGDNEYTANITPVDSVTGVWVRPYLDLGGGLIVYGPAQYFESASDYFNNKGVNDTSTPTDKQNINFGIDTLNVKKVDNKTNKAQVYFAPETNTLAKVQARVTEAYQAAATGNKAKDAPTVKVKQAGVVLDKKGVLKMADGKTWASITDDDNAKANATTLYPTANADLILGKGFVEGKKTSNFTADYTGKVSPAGKDLIVRNYVIYEIGDTELTVYGEPMAYQYNGTFWKYIGVPV